MTKAIPRVKGFFGAPLAKSLDWDDDDLVGDLQPDFQLLRRILANEVNISLNRRLPPAPEDNDIKWRRVSTESNARLHTGFTQPSTFLKTQNTFQDPAAERSRLSLPSALSSSSLSSSDSSVPSDYPTYLRHSLSLHYRLGVSHLSHPPDTQDISTFRSGLSFASAYAPSTFVDVPSTLPPLLVPANLVPTRLSDLPSASRLNALQPQTPTATLLVAVITTNPRSILVKRRPSKRSTRKEPLEPQERWLVDLLVADTSRAGFKCTFWLPEGSQPETGVVFRDGDEPLDVPVEKLCALRAGSVILIHRIALTVFADTAYGQSLNPYVAKQKTSVDILVNSQGTDLVSVEDRSWKETIDTMREWVQQYVGGRGMKRPARNQHKAKIKARKFMQDDLELPPDSMIQ